MSGHAEGRKRRSWFSIAMMIFLVILWTVPTLGLLVSSFRPRIDIERTGWWTALFNPFSSDWTFSNYTRTLQGEDMAGSFINSIVVAVPATVLPIMFAAFAAYAFTFMRFWGRDIIFVLIVALMVVPIQAAFVPLLTLLGPDGLGINGTFLAVWFLHTGFGISTADALAYGVILQAVEIATAVTLGLPALVREGLTWSDLRVQALSTAPVRLDPHPRAGRRLSSDQVPG